MKDYSYELLDLLEKYKGDAEAALRGETSPWCLYAFSPLRENLFEWLEIGKKDRVLQVGSDYGSCTGLFAERAGEVVVLDPLDENLEVNRKRHGEKENLCLVRGELPKAGTESLGWKEYKGKERAAEELDALYKDGFDYVILPSMLSYPVPDYRYPVTIYSDGYLPQTGDVTNISARLDGPGLWFGNEEKAMANACRNGDFTKFTNSFLGMWEKGKA